MVSFVVGVSVGILVGAWVAYTYSSKLIADAQNIRARLENEIAKLENELKKF
jgi:hypothetical protein